MRLKPVKAKARREKSASPRKPSCRTPVEKALQASEKQYRATVDSLQEALHVVDAKLNIFSFNRTFAHWCERLGLPKVRGGQPLFDVFPSLPKQVQAEYRRVFRTGRTVETEETTRIGGETIITETIKTPVFANGRVERVITVMRDITKRKEMEESLRKSERIYREIYNATSEAIAVEDVLTGRFLEVNDPMVRMYGYSSKEELMACSIGDLSKAVPPYTQEEALRLHELVMAGSPQVFEWIAKKKSGELFNVEVSLSISPIRGNNRILAVVRDISARKKTEEALRESESSYRGLFDSVKEAIYIQDREGRFLDVNQGAVEMYGHPKAFFIGKTPEIVSAPGRNNLAAVRRAVEEAFNGTPQQFEFWGLRSNREIFPKEVYLIKGTYFGQEVIIALARDVTERKRAEASLQESHNNLELKVKERTAKLRALAAQLVRAEEQERQRIAHILHEDLQQMMTGARLMLRELRQLHSKEDAKQMTDKVIRILEKANDVARSLTLDLRPPMLYESGLAAALKWLAENTKKKLGLEVQVRIDKAAEPKPTELRVFVFEAVRELLFNVAKHAGVKKAQLTVGLAAGNRIQVAVKDSGKGFEAVPGKSKGFGLFSLRERAESFDGEMRICSASGKGTSVTLTLPNN